MPSFLKPTQPGVDMTSVGRFLMLSVVGLFLVSSEVSAGMFGFGKKTEVHLSPEVNGIVTLNGTPIKGAQVVRTLDYDQEYREERVTGADGRFDFPEKNIVSARPNKMLDETRVRQIITVNYEGTKYLLWYATPGTIKWRTGIANKLAAMRCELTNSEIEHGFENVEKPQFPHSTFSICRWND